MREPELQEWVAKMKPDEKASYTLNDEIFIAVDRFYFNHYCQAFRSGAFARANCSMSVVSPPRLLSLRINLSRADP